MSAYEAVASSYTVVHPQTRGCCRVCFGAEPGYGTCYKCGREWAGLPEFPFADLIVPCTVVRNPSPWYTALATYKQGSWDTYAVALVYVLSTWWDHHRSRVEYSLGGHPEIVGVVPSRHRPLPTPLFQIGRSVPAFEPMMSELAQVGPGQTLPSRRLAPPDAFVVSPDATGKRVVLIEDTWVTGATALSTARAIQTWDPASLAIISIARKVNPDALTPEFEAALTQPASLATWVL